MNDKIAQVKIRLEEWGFYYAKKERGALGYPSKNMIALWREGWSIAVDGYGYKPLPLSEAAEAMEKHVIALSQVYPQAAEVLRSEYLDTHERMTKAPYLGMSISRYRMHLDVAYAWLAGRMSIIKSEIT